MANSAPYWNLWIIPILTYSKGFCLQCPPTSKPFLTIRLWGQGCFLMLFDGIQYCICTPHWGLSFILVIPGRKNGFGGMRERTWNCYAFLKPAWNTSHAVWFSHCVFFLSFGTNTAFLYQKEGYSCSQTWGGERLPLLPLLYVFVVFLVWFLKISKACAVLSSVCLPT